MDKLTPEQKKQAYQIAKDFSNFIESFGNDYSKLSEHLGISVSHLEEILIALQYIGE